jgi:hypothetical protein
MVSQGKLILRLVQPIVGGAISFSHYLLIILYQKNLTLSN